MMPTNPEDAESIVRIGYIKPFEADEIAEVYLHSPDWLEPQIILIHGQWLIDQGIIPETQVDLTVPHDFQPETVVAPLAVRIHETTEVDKQEIIKKVDEIMGSIDLDAVRKKFDRIDET